MAAVCEASAEGTKLDVAWVDLPAIWCFKFRSAIQQQVLQYYASTQRKRKSWESSDGLPAKTTLILASGTLVLPIQVQGRAMLCFDLATDSITG